MICGLGCDTIILRWCQGLSIWDPQNGNTPLENMWRCRFWRRFVRLKRGCSDFSRIHRGKQRTLSIHPNPELPPSAWFFDSFVDGGEHVSFGGFNECHGHIANLRGASCASFQGRVFSGWRGWGKMSDFTRLRPWCDHQSWFLGRILYCKLCLNIQY